MHPWWTSKGSLREVQTLKILSPQANWFKRCQQAYFLVWTQKSPTLPGEGVFDTHLKFKKSRIQWNKFEVICSSFAQSNWAAKLGYLDSTLACARFGSLCFGRFLLNSFWVFLTLKWCYNIYQVFPQRLVPFTPKSCFYPRKKTRKFPFTQFETMCQLLS